MQCMQCMYAKFILLLKPGIWFWLLFHYLSCRHIGRIVERTKGNQSPGAQWNSGGLKRIFLLVSIFLFMYDCCVGWLFTLVFPQVLVWWNIYNSMGFYLSQDHVLSANTKWVLYHRNPFPMAVFGSVMVNSGLSTEKPRSVEKQWVFESLLGSMAHIFQCWRLLNWRITGGWGSGKFIAILTILSCLLSFLNHFRTDLSRIKQDCLYAKGTLVDWASFFRQVCLYIQDSLGPLGGDGRVIEIDESLFGKRKYGKGERDHEGVWVLGGVERATGRIFLNVVEQRDTETMAPLLSKNIKPGSIVFSDMWKAYDRLW